MRRARYGIHIGLGIALLLLASCGGGGDTGGPASASGIDQDISATRGGSGQIGGGSSSGYSDGFFNNREAYGH
jgi:hypothetical protein